MPASFAITSVDVPWIAALGEMAQRDGQDLLATNLGRLAHARHVSEY